MAAAAATPDAAMDRVRAKLRDECIGCGRGAAAYRGERFSFAATLPPDTTLEGWTCAECYAELFSEAVHLCSLANAGVFDAGKRNQ